MLSPTLFRRETLQILYDSQVAFRDDDFAGMWGAMELLDQAAPLVKGDKQRSAFDYAYNLVVLNIGITLANYGQFEEARLIAECVDARWRDCARRQPDKPFVHPEVRCTLLNLLGYLKSVGSVSICDAVLKPTAQVDEMRRLADYIFERTEPLVEMDPPFVAMLRESVGWAFVQNIKMALRLFTPSRVAAMVSHFNRLFGYKLTTTLVDWRVEDAALPDPDCCWAYEVEMHKMHRAGLLDEPTEKKLWDLHDTAARHMASSAQFDLRHYLTASAKNRKRLKSGVELEVLSA